MISIIAVHCLYAWGMVGSGQSATLQVALVQAAKFGTIAFYFISGFLLGTKLDQYSPLEYLRRRIRSTATPWTVWACILAVLPIVQAFVGGWAPRGRHDLMLWMYRDAKDVLFHSPYWFVPNFLFSLAILLVFRHRLDNLRLGAVFALLSLFYGVNAYKRWVPSPHTAAIFGFVFYQWLGVWAARNSSLLFRAVQRISWNCVILLVSAATLLALVESSFMMRLGISALDAMNTLRITNQLFSLCVVLAFLKLNRRAWPAWVDVRANTYGLYLIHPVSVWLGVEMLKLLYRAIRPWAWPSETLVAAIWTNPLASLFAWTSLFGVVYLLSLKTTRLLVASRSLGWTVNALTPNSGSRSLKGEMPKRHTGDRQMAVSATTALSSAQLAPEPAGGA